MTKAIAARLLSSSLAITPLMALVAGCPSPHDEDIARTIAVGGDRVVVAAETVSVGGGGWGGCGAPDIDGEATLFVSSDRGATYQRIQPDNAWAIRELGYAGDHFYALRSSDWDGYMVERSPDGITWTEVVRGTDAAGDMMIDADGIHVAHANGIMSSIDGTVWTEELSAETVGYGYYAPHLARVGDTLIMSQGTGEIRVRESDDTWSDRVIPGVTAIHHLSAIGGHGLAVGHVMGPDQLETLQLISFDLSEATEPSYIAIFDEMMSVVDAPAGALLADGTLAREPSQLAARDAHTSAFRAGAVDNDRVVLLTALDVLLSDDGGESFAAPIALPLVK